MSGAGTVFEAIDWQGRFDAAIAARRERSARRAEARAESAEARRRGLQQRRALKLAVADRIARTDEIDAYRAAAVARRARKAAPRRAGLSMRREGPRRGAPGSAGGA